MLYGTSRMQGSDPLNLQSAGIQEVLGNVDTAQLTGLEHWAHE